MKYLHDNAFLQKVQFMKNTCWCIVHDSLVTMALMINSINVHWPVTCVSYLHDKV